MHSEPPYRVNEDYDIAFTARISPEKADVSRSVSLSHPEQRDWPCCTGTKPNAAFFAQNDGQTFFRRNTERQWADVKSGAASRPIRLSPGTFPIRETQTPVPHFSK